MSSIPPPSQAGVPTGGNGKYIAVGLLLLVGIIGLVAFKTCGSTPDPTPKPIASVAPSAPSSTVNTTRIDDVPPPPDPEDASVAPVTTKIVNGGPTNVCDVKSCNGTTSTELENGLNMVARQTRRKCYESALGNDPTLKGHVKLSLRIGSNGQVCSSTVASNDMSNTSVGDCAARTFMASHLPAPKGGCVNVDFPLAYVPAGQQ
jgi:hypothetical protein